LTFQVAIFMAVHLKRNRPARPDKLCDEAATS